VGAVVASEPSVDGIPVTLDEASVRWVDDLSGDGRVHEAAVVRLHELLLRVARNELRRRGAVLRIAGPELDDLAYQAAADAVIAITAKLSTFRGESRFTTWAYRFVILEVSSKVGRHFWRHPTVSVDVEQWDQLPDRFGVDPAGVPESHELAAEIHRAVDEDLTEWQRQVFVAIVLQEIPLDALVVELASTRNAIYKTLFDARRKLRAVLAANGYLTDDPPRHR
jgi:RNA polymerase sigma-70 factor (ECF subfamily)